MHITLEKAMDAFYEFMADQVMTINNLGLRFAGLISVGALKKNPEGLLSKVKPWMEMSGILKDGMVDVEAMKMGLDNAFSVMPKLSYLGFGFTSEDASALLSKMEARMDKKKKKKTEDEA